MNYLKTGLSLDILTRTLITLLLLTISSQSISQNNKYCFDSVEVAKIRFVIEDYNSVLKLNENLESRERSLLFALSKAEDALTECDKSYAMSDSIASECREKISEANEKILDLSSDNERLSRSVKVLSISTSALAVVLLIVILI